MPTLPQDSASLPPVAILLLLCLAVCTWCVSQRHALFPLLVVVCYLSVGQAAVIGGLHFPVLRFLLLVGLCRAWLRREGVGLRFTALDRIFLWWVIATLAMGTAAGPSVQRFVNRAGVVFDAAATYFLCRCWVRDLDGLRHVAGFLAVLVVPLALGMIVEKISGRNFFYLLGGVAEYGEVRDGRLRCQGAFRHPILAGTYAATLLPCLVGLLFNPHSRGLALVGSASAGIAVCASGSSGALLAMLTVAVGCASWRIKNHMRHFRWALVLVVLGFALVMNAPVWYLIARISTICGGTGWHRSYLIDQAVQHFGEWWLTGSTYTAHWAPSGMVLPSDPNNMDITNQYIAEGLGGGVLKLGLFLYMIILCYKTVGRLVIKTTTFCFSDRIFVWSVGVSLTAHCVSFISISYFDQIVVMWYLLLASVSMLSSLETKDPLGTEDANAPRPIVVNPVQTYESL